MTAVRRVSIFYIGAKNIVREYSLDCDETRFVIGL